jgi:hypothetical protein
MLELNSKVLGCLVIKKNLNFLTNLLKCKLQIHKSEQFQLYIKSLQPNNCSLESNNKAQQTQKKNPTSPTRKWSISYYR